MNDAGERGGLLPNYDGAKLHLPNLDPVADAHAQLQETKAKLLAEAIPALSYAAGANAVDNFGTRNFDMSNVEYKSSSASDKWKHSSVKEFPLQWNSALYEKFIELGELNEK